MMRTVLMLCMAMLLVGGCASPHLTVSESEYRERVKVLGVLPLILDPDSAIEHPERERVVEVVQRAVRDVHLQLVERLRQQKGYFDVRAVPGEARDLRAALLRGAEPVGEGLERHLRYRFNPGAVAATCERDGVDGLAVVVLHGVVRPEKRWDRAPLTATFLEAPFNAIVASAYVVDARGTVLWEKQGEAPTIVQLQYPAFDEAFYHRSDRVPVYPIRSDGIERTLAPAEGDRGGRLVPELEDLVKMLARELDTRPRRPF